MIENYNSQRYYENLYAAYWTHARTLPGLIKSRILTMLEPLDPQDDLDLWLYITSIGQTLQKELNHAA